MACCARPFTFRKLTLFVFLFYLLPLLWFLPSLQAKDPPREETEKLRFQIYRLASTQKPDSVPLKIKVGEKTETLYYTPQTLEIEVGAEDFSVVGDYIDPKNQKNVGLEIVLNRTGKKKLEPITRNESLDYFAVVLEEQVCLAAPADQLLKGSRLTLGPVFNRRSADRVLQRFIHVEEIGEDKPHEILLIIIITGIIFAFIVATCIFFLYYVRIRVIRARLK